MSPLEMINIIVSFSSMSFRFVQTLVCSIFQQVSECPMQKKTMLAAIRATDERLIAPRYLMQISVQLAFSYTKRVLFACKTLVAIYWMHRRVNLICINSFCLQKKQLRPLFITRHIQCDAAEFNVYK